MGFTIFQIMRRRWCVTSCEFQVVRRGFHVLMEGLFRLTGGQLATMPESRWETRAWQSSSIRFIPVEKLGLKWKDAFFYSCGLFMKSVICLFLLKFAVCPGTSSRFTFHDVFFLGYFQDIDTYSWHCGCPVIRGTKWASNAWAWNQPMEKPPFATRRPLRPKMAGNLPPADEL